jgi:hypothetical protein
MTNDVLERYRRCDPAQRAALDWETVGTMVRRRLDDPVSHDRQRRPSREAGRSRSASSRWRVITACAVALGAVATIGVAFASSGSEGDRRLAAEPASEPTPNATHDVPAALPTSVGDLPAQVQALAIDSLADGVADATNAGAVRDAVALLSPTSDCDWPMSPSRLATSCDDFWSYQVTTGVDVAFRSCAGTVRQRCTLTMATRPAAMMGRPDRARDLRVELELDGDQLAVRRAPNPSRAQSADADDRRALRRDA